ncbi:MAG: AarF/ABC1/UbiB kinase family protein [Leptonema sp. (in: Bacteria)]|nr:AarF/ABC1/UbiB kinase family protein [Leptonema sp. (in: bacteria)]
MNQVIGRSAKQAAGLAQIVQAVENLSRLKGAPMKIGQMLSLHDDLLPPEITSIFKMLQSDAKSAPFQQIEHVLQSDLGDRLSQLTIENKPMAAASIGQVHKATTYNNRNIVLKVQYPEIREAMKSDLKSLKLVFASLFQFFELPFDQLWLELVDRLYEELDYENELSNLNLYRKQLQIEGIIVPEPLPEFSSKRVLAMVYEPSMTLDQSISYLQTLPQDESNQLRLRWSMKLLQLVTDGLFYLKLLHADPNAGNFGFRENGNVVLYDLGCMKKVPPNISDVYLEVSRNVWAHNYAAIPDLLFTAGFFTTQKNQLSIDLLKPHFDLIHKIFPDKQEAFGSDPFVYAEIAKLGRDSWQESKHIVFPSDIVFIHRTLGGHFGNLRRLAAKANWNQEFGKLLKINSTPE